LSHLDTSGEVFQYILSEVVAYVTSMRNRYLENHDDEITYVQPEVRNKLIPNTVKFMRTYSKSKLVSEKEYTLMEENDMGILEVGGKTDHAIEMIDSSLALLTLEDKAILHEITKREISQVVTQVKHEIQSLEIGLNYVPKEFVGLLQNGSQFVAILRRIDRGRVLWTNIRSSLAFTSKETVNGMRSASEIDLKSCEEIARILEHAYVTADKIAEEIMDPYKRPNLILQNIQEFRQGQDYDEFGSDDEEEEAPLEQKKRRNETTREFGSQLVSTLSTQLGSKKISKDINSSSFDSYSKGDIYDENHDYFLLPLSSKNLETHKKTFAN